MVKVYDKVLTEKSVVASPKDEILSGIITNIQQGLLSEFIDSSVHSKFDNLHQETLLIEYEVKYGDKILKGNDKFGYYAEPMSNSKLGKFLTKYKELKTGMPIKVMYNAEGFGKIVV